MKLLCKYENKFIGEILEPLEVILTQNMRKNKPGGLDGLRGFGMI
jgi:hypothetical protein